LSAAAVRDIVRRRCALAGVQGDFSAHSLRSGFVTKAVRQDVPLADTMALTGHRSVQSVMGYAQSSAGRRALRLLESRSEGVQSHEARSRAQPAPSYSLYSRPTMAEAVIARACADPAAEVFLRPRP